MKSNMLLKRYSPVILSCLASLGVVATSLLAIKATPKATELLRRSEEEKGEKLTKMEVIRAVGPAYIPTILTGISTITCILGANAINQRNQAVLTSAYVLLDQTYKRYRCAAKAVYGEDADSNIRIEMAKDTYVSFDSLLGGGYTYDPDLDQASEKVLFYDAYSRRYFNASMASVINAEYHVNRNLALGGIVSVNDFYDFLGIDNINDGDINGWSIHDILEDGFSWLDFDNRHTKMEDGLECYIISATFDPIRLDLDMH